MKVIGQWQREFQVWQYSVSHSVLLLRSYHPDLYATRVDLAFLSVGLMKVQASYESLTVQVADPGEVARFLGETALPYGSLFLLNGGAGYVHAGRCSWHEDEGDHKTPSRFGPLRGTP
jgi:hypothetical protein